MANENDQTDALVILELLHKKHNKKKLVVELPCK